MNGSNRVASCESLENRRLFANVAWNASASVDVSGDDTFVLEQVGNSVSVKLNGSPAGSYTMNPGDYLALNTGAGNDTITSNLTSVLAQVNAGAGNDAYTGGQGIDLFYGDDGDDTFFGNDGNDQAEGGAGNDYLEGGIGADQLNGQAGNDLVLGGKGNDVLNGAEGSDTTSGGDGDDSISDSAGAGEFDSGTGGQGADRMYASCFGTGTSMMQGGAGDDLLKSWSGSAYFYGNEGDDSFVMSNSVADLAIRGGEGTDIAYIDRNGQDSTPGVIDSISTLIGQ